MPLIILAIGIALLLVLMLVFKLDSFTSLIIVAIAVGIGQGMPLVGNSKAHTIGVLDAIEDGVGSQASVLLIVAFGAMLGVIMADFGAANRLATTLMDVLGVKRAQLAVIIVAFLVGVVMFYEAAFVLLIPIVFAIVRRTRVPLLWLAVPLSIALSTMHSFLPPHPGPTAVAGIFGASIGKTLLLGLPIALVCGTALGLLWPRLAAVRKAKASIPAGMVPERDFKDGDMPSFGYSLLIAVCPIVLIAGTAVVDMLVADRSSVIMHVIDFVGQAPVALLIGVLAAIGYFAVRRGVPMEDIASTCKSGIKAIAMIVFIVSAGGAFKQVLVDGGISDYIGSISSGWHVSALLLGWLVAVLMRLALGSASVAVMAAAGIVLPLVQAGGVSPELMTLAVACGSVFCSHVNDPGFWMFKEFLGLSLPDTFKIRSTYTSVLSTVGLGGVLLMSLAVPV